MIKKIISYAKQYKWLALLTPVLVMLEAGSEILIPMVMSKMIDEGIKPGNLAVTKEYGIQLLILAFFALLVGIAAGLTAPIASMGFAKNLRQALYDKVQKFSFSNIDKFSTGSIVTRLTTDVSNIQMAFQMCIRIVVRAPAMLIFAFTAAYRINKRMSLIFLAVTPILVLGMWIINKHVGPVFDRVFKTYDKLNGVVRENLYAVRVVKSYNRQDHENKKFRSISERIFSDFSYAEKTLAFMMPLMQMCVYACTILICWIGARFIIASGNNELVGFTTGQLMSMITYTMQILMSLMIINMILVMSTMAITSCKRIVELIDEEPDIQNPKTCIYQVANGQIDFEDVEFEYFKSGDDASRKKVLTDIDLHIPSGATVGILGGTGSSKSSLVQLIPRLYDVTSGRVRVGLIDVRDYDIKSLRDAVSMVLQKNVLFSGTVASNLRWGNENATLEEMKHACKVAHADEFIEQMEGGYDAVIEQGGANLSGGQKQRLCIARALLKNPKILILDDSTSAVDMRTDAAIREALKTEMPETTKIIIAQRIASIQESDIIVVLDAGRIVATGKHDELMKTCDIYREVYVSQNKGGEQNA